MFNQVILSIGRKLSAHIFTTCILCILILVVLIGGLIQVISSLAFGAYLESRPSENSIYFSSTSEPLSLVVDGGIDQSSYSLFARMNKTFSNANQSKSLNGIQTSVASFKNERDKFNGRSFPNTKILYKPYTANSNAQPDDKDTLNKSPTSPTSKSKTINSTAYKSVTPSITDRVIADLKKEEYFNQQRNKASGDGIETGENDEAIYIDGDDDEEETNTPDTTTEIETSVEKLPDESTINQPDEVSKVLKSKPRPAKKSSQTIATRDKKSFKKPSIISKKFTNLGFVGNSDTDSSEAVDIDDDDYDDYSNSGSGDFSSQLIEQNQGLDWVSPTIDKIKAKKLNKQERIMKSFADNSYDISDSSKEFETDPIDYVDNDEEQMISRKIAKAHKKQNAMQTASKMENQKLKTKQNIRQKSNTSNKRKSKEQRLNIDEYFSGSKSVDGTEAELVKNGWMEPRIRRILGNIKKSEERSQQILLCKGEGELCSMLFKTPIKPAATP